MISHRNKITAILFSIFLSVIVPSLDAQSTWQSRLQIGLPSSASALAYSNDATLIAVGHTDGTVSVWDTHNGNKFSVFGAGNEKINQLRFISNATELITLNEDKQARIWQISDGKEIGQLEGVSSSFEISHDGQWLVAQDPNQVIWLWDLKGRARSVQLSKLGNGGVRAFTFSPTGDYIVCSYGGKPYLIDLKSKENIEIAVKGDVGKSTKVKIEPTGKDRATISIGEMQDDDAPTYRILSGNVSAIIVLSRRWMNGFVDVWNTTDKTRIARFSLSKDDSMYQILETSLSHDDTFVAIGGKKNLSIWDIKKGLQVATFPGNGQIQFSPNADELSVAMNDKLDFYVRKK